MLRSVLRVVFFVVLMVIIAPGALARPRVALVLGGGAARGFSHVGLLRAFEEEGVPIDMIVAASMGSVLSGLYASGFTIAELEYMAQRVDLAELFSVTLPPKGGVVNTERFERFLHELTGGARFEDLRIPYYTVVTNLLTGESVVLREGELSRAIVASMSIPGMFPPVEIDGQLYVDGGIKDPVPARFARELGADVVIAVDVRRELENPNRDSIMNNLQLTLYFLMDQNTELHMDYVDVLVSPDVHYDTYMDYQRAGYFVEKGYQAGRAAIPEIKAFLLQKDPGITFEPRYDPSDVGDDVDERLGRALTAARSTPGGTGARLRSAWRWQEGGVPQFTLNARLPLMRAGSSAILGGYAVQQDLGDEGVRTFELGASAGAAAGFAFLRKGPAEEAWRPGVRLELRRSPLSGGDDTFEAEWEWHEPGDPWAQWSVALTHVRPLGSSFARGGASFQIPERELSLVAGRDARGLIGTVEPFLDLQARVYLPVGRSVVSELAIANTAAFAGIGARVQAEDEGAKASWTGEAGLRFELRFFGLYPLHSRFSFTYGSGDRWGVALVIGS